MKSEEAVAILASEGRAQVAVSCQHARRSLLPPAFALFVFVRAPLPAALPRTWGGRIIIWHLNYLAGNTVLFLFLFEQTHIYPDDDQGL